MKLKQTLVLQILENKPIPNKYSKSFLNLENAYKLEIRDGFTVSKEITILYKKIKSLYKSFVNGIPLIVIERYYFENIDNPKKIVFIEHKSKEIEIKIIELYQLLEDFYSMMFEVSCLLVSYYNLEIKLNQDISSNDTNYI